MSRNKTERTRSKQPAKGRRFTEEQREHALLLVRSGISKAQVARAVGTTEQSVLRWHKQAEQSGQMPTVPKRVKSEAKREGQLRPNEQSAVGQTDERGSDSRYRPKDAGQGLSEAEQEAILHWKKQHPSMGPAQIRAQLKRFKGWRISIKAIARVLNKHGYEPVHRGSRAQGAEPKRFEAPRRNALWQMDYSELRVGLDKRQVLLIIDDYSRYAVGCKLCESTDGQQAVQLMQQAIARHGKPEAVRTDRGSGFLSQQFCDFLEVELIDQIVGRAYHPQGGGKVESIIGTLKRELWEVEQFDDFATAEPRLMQWIENYNEQRAHMGIDGLTPADRYFGRAQRVLEAVNALSRKRNAAYLQNAEPGGPLQEVGSGAPMEVLRLVLLNGQMELRLCGSRVKLGPVEN